MSKHPLLILICFLFVQSCSKSTGDPVEAENYRRFDAVTAYLPNSPYAGRMKNCVTIVGSDDSCSILEMPFIGNTYDQVTVDDVMEHLMVSHSWMGDRFAEALNELPPVMLTLLKSVTAIVIDSEINPSFYYPGTGAIYLNPDYLWLLTSEKETISDIEDYRLEYGSELQFLEVARYIQVSTSEPTTSTDGNRSLDDILVELAAVLFHELTHANDFFPNNGLNQLPKNFPLLDLAYNNYENSLSRQMLLHSPLDDQTLFDLAEVIFGGSTILNKHKSMTAESVAELFEPTGANDLYNFYRVAEDVAMLFEEYMMLKYFNTQRDFALLLSPDVEEPKCNDYKIAWGQRLRLASNEVKARAEFVSTKILGDSALDLNSLTSPQLLPVEKGWCEYMDSMPVQESKPGSGEKYYIRSWDAPRPK